MCRSNMPLRHNKDGIEKNLNLKSVTMIEPETGWFGITYYDDKRATPTSNLVETT